MLLRSICSDFYKSRHTGLPLVHLLLPLFAAAAFLLYYSVSSWGTADKLSAYFEAIGASFPLVIGLVCGRAADQEAQAGAFQNMLCGLKSRSAIFAGKLLSLLFSGLFSISLAVAVFALGFGAVSAEVYVKAGFLLFFGGIFLYILHTFVSLLYGNGASIGLGIAETLVSALALTGLGDRIWYYIPCTWSARFADLVMYGALYPGSGLVSSEMRKCLYIAIPVTVFAFILSLLWFNRWEGRKTYD